MSIEECPEAPLAQHIEVCGTCGMWLLAAKIDRIILSGAATRVELTGRTGTKATRSPSTSRSS